jgi:hypothetical protein
MCSLFLHTSQPHVVCAPLLRIRAAVPRRRAAEAARRRAEARLELHPYTRCLLARLLPSHIADPGWDIQVRLVPWGACCSWWSGSSRPALFTIHAEAAALGSCTS